MNHEIRMDESFGRVLFLSDGRTEVGAALDFGLRIVHLSCCGMPNLLYRQPDDCSDGLTDPRGWRIFGGHRFWSAPESDKSYYPDREPVAYTITEDGAELRQKVDPWLREEKTIRIAFRPDGAVCVRHCLKNCADAPVRAAAWGVSTTAGGGTVTIPFAGQENGYNPQRTIALWGETSLADERLHFTADALTAEHLPRDGYLKLGLYCTDARIIRHNLGQRFEISIPVHPIERCADFGSNIELFMDRNILEMETLGELVELAPGDETIHEEIWRVEKSD